MSVRIGQASWDENKKYRGGKAGDQTKNEVFATNWYPGWHTVFRAKSNAVAEKIAKSCEQACANDKIGYDQGQRATLYDEAVKVNFNLSKIKTPCEADCSSLVAVCCIAAGVYVSKDMYTGNEKKCLESTGLFYTYTDSKHIGSHNYLKRGDILLTNGHTAIVLTDGDKLHESAKTNLDVKYYKKYTGTSGSITPALYEIGEKDVSLRHRAKIAVANGFVKTEDDWKGTVAQNNKMLSVLKAGKLIKA